MYHILFFAFIATTIVFVFNNRSSKRLNSDGYVVFKDGNELEHRHIAKKLLQRDLFKNEVVHHINGRKIDNEITNLCLMDRFKHEQFHSWLRWKKEKSGKYPSISYQKKILTNEYNGTLLENLSRSKPVQPRIEEKAFIPSLDVQRKLFHVLRAERKRIAAKNNIPVYIIFKNQTLVELSQKLPTTEADMLQVKGVGPEKMRLYGRDFINVINEFKKNTA
jgi:superfamily II DNA helicase RecQ